MGTEELGKRIEKRVLDFGTKMKEITLENDSDFRIVLLMNPREFQRYSFEYKNNLIGKWFEIQGEKGCYLYRNMKIIFSEQIEDGKIEIGMFIN